MSVLLGDARREDGVEEAQHVVASILDKSAPAYDYRPNSCGPQQADVVVADEGGRHNPVLTDVHA